MGRLAQPPNARQWKSSWPAHTSLNRGSTPLSPLLSTKIFRGSKRLPSYQVAGFGSSGSSTNGGGSSSIAHAPTPCRVPFPPQSSAWAARAAPRAAATAAEDYNPDARHSSSSSSCEGKGEQQQQQLQPAKRRAATGQERSPSTTEFWQQQSASGGGRDRFPELMLLAELVLVMVPTSVGDECMFSTMKCIRNPQRSLLKQEHVKACARGFKSKFSVGSFPYPEAIGAWLDACKVRGRYGLK